MADILCLDTVPETVNALQRAGHTVLSAFFGYRNGYRLLKRAPQDFDLIVCDLRQPACFDISRWGTLGNSNFSCTIIPDDQVNWNSRSIIRNGGVPTEEIIHRLIYETQIERMNKPSPFGPKDIREAIAVGGVPALIFLNPEWVLRTGGHEFPDFVGLRWGTQMTEARKIALEEPLESLSASWDPGLAITTPVRCKLTSGPSLPLRFKNSAQLYAQPLIVDRVGSLLGQLVTCGKGLVWMLPATDNNATTACHFARNVDAISRMPSVPIPANSGAQPMSATWDLFMSHASEDKAFTDDLYAALTSRGVQVWYDKSVLTMGDSLRRKIEEGLARSRFGVVVLSQAFLNKQWPQAELDALFAMSMTDGKKRILPIWHDIDKGTIAQHSPFMLDLLAARSSEGLDKNVQDILTAIDWPNNRAART
jgi:hypothetical protein